MNDVFAVVESEGVDLFDPHDFHDRFNEMKSEPAISLLGSRELNVNSNQSQM